MSRLIAALIRHADYQQLADTPSALQPFQLTEEGFEQASSAAKLITRQCLQQGWEINPDIACSKQLRAWQTASTLAESLAQHTNYSIEEYTELAERHVGSVANLAVKDVEKIVKLDPRYPDLPENWKSNSHFCLPFQGAESLFESGKRVADFLQQQMQNRLKQAYSTDQLHLFIGHGAAFRHAAYHLGVLQFEQIAQLSMHHCQPIYLEYTAENKWQHIAGNWKVRQTNTQYTD